MYCWVEMAAPFQPGRELGIVRAASHIDHKGSGRREGCRRPCPQRHQVQHEVYPGGHAGAAEAAPIFDEQPVFKYPRPRRHNGQLGAACVMGRAVIAVQQPGAAREQAPRRKP